MCRKGKFIKTEDSSVVAWGWYREEDKDGD
jgi:hypothetical protein